MLRLPGFIYRNKFSLPPLPKPGKFEGQTIIITGATSGLGLATAVHFVNLGASTVVITGRSISKAERAKAIIEAQTGTQGKDVIKTMELDMSTFAGVKKFADQVKAEVENIDYLLLNAGMMTTSFSIGAHGFEETIQVNTLSTTLLALLLLPWIKKTGGGKAHLAVVSSGLHRGVDISTGSWPQEEILSYWSQKVNQPKGNKMYSISKLLVQYCTNEIAKLATSSSGSPQVIVNTLCPGMVKSELGREYRTNALLSIAMDGFMNTVMKSTEGGARTLVLTAMTTAEENGKYITHYQSDTDYKQAVQHNVLGEEGQKMQSKVWKEVIGVLGSNIPEVKAIVEGTAA